MNEQDTGYGIQDTGYRIQESEESGERAPLTPESCIPSPELCRLRWRARRGLLELDIVLGRFIDMHYAQLAEAEKRAFDALLDMPDNPLWDMIAGKQDATQGEEQALLEKIRAA